MKIKLLVKGILVLLPFFVIWGYLYLFPMNYIDEEVPYYLWNKDFCNETHDEDYDVVILGDSVMNADFIPEALSDSTVNLSLGGSTPVENYYVISDYIKHNKCPKVIYIGFADGHMESMSAFYERTLYAHRFSFAQEKEMIDRTKENGEGTINRDNARLEWLQYHFSFPTKYITAFLNGNVLGRRAENTEHYNVSESNLGRYIISEGSIEDQTEYEYNHYGIEPYIDNYMRQIIELCRDNDIKLRIIVPINAPSISYTDEYTSVMHEYYDGLKGEYPFITLDYQPGESLTMEDFADHWHLNQKGAEKFSAQIKELYPKDFE